MSLRIAAITLCLSIVPGLATAQGPQAARPRKEHQFLKRFAGEWTSLSKSVAQGDQPAAEYDGSMSSKMLGGFWAVNRFEGDAGGMKFQAIQTIGYDPVKKKYVGTWVDSMMNHMWQYEGEVDATGNKLMLVADGPNFMTDGKTTKFRDSYEFKTPDRIIVTSEMMSKDGKWGTFMTGEMKRTKAKKQGP